MIEIRILFLTTLYPGYNNQSRQDISYALHNFVKDWVKEGHEVRVIRIWNSYPRLFKFFRKGKDASLYNKDFNFVFEEIKINRIVINKIPKINYLKRDLDKTFLKIKNSIERDFSPQIIVTHMLNPSIILGSKLKEVYKIPLVITMHKTDLEILVRKNKQSEKFMSILENTDKIGFRSEHLMYKFNKIKRSNLEKKIFTIPSGIEDDIPINDEKIKNKKYKKISTIFIAAKMVPLKNIDILINAFKTVSKSNDIILKIAGDGPQRKELEKIVQDNKLKDRVQFLGFLDRNKILKQMEESDIFVMVSSPETFGLVYLEAMAKGCITIGTKKEGIDGIIINEKNGFLCEARNTKDLANVLNKVIEMSPEDKINIIRSAVNTAKKMSQIKMSNKYIDILNNLIEDTN